MQEYATGSKRPADLIGVRLDLNVGTLEYYRNDQKLGIAFIGVKGPVSPCISLIKGQKVTIKHK